MRRRAPYERGTAPYALALGVLIAACGPASSPASSSAETTDRGVARLAGDPARALALVERALEATAGPEELEAAGGLVIEAEGVKNAGAEFQGVHPDSLSPGRFRETLTFEADLSRVGYAYRHDRYDGTYESVHDIYAPPDERLLMLPEAGFAIRLASPDHERARMRIARRHPGLLLDEVRSRAAGVRWLGGDAELQLVSVSLAGGETLNLGFDRAEGLLRRASYAQDAAGFGDVAVEWRFDDYRPVDGAGTLPHAWGVSVGGRPFTDMRVDAVRTGEAAIAAEFEAPPGVNIPDSAQRIGANSDASSDAEVREVAPGVYMAVSLRGGFHPLFVEFEDFVVAVDAPAGYPLWDELPASDVAPGPTGAWLSERFLELIRETVPDKPVRYVVLTHFHNDHAGGLRAFVAEGTTVLASPSAAEAVRALASAPHSLGPDRLAREGGDLRLEIVEGRRTIGDGSRTLEVIDVGANPHTTHMLVVRLLEEEVWFVSDLLDPTRVEAFPKPEHEALDRWFAGWLDAGGHEPERIYTMHGSGLVTPEHLARLKAPTR